MDSQVSSRPLEIFVIPYLTPGHLIPLSELACLFAVRGEHVTIITTTTKAAVIQKTINKFSSSGHPVSLHPIPFPSKEAGLPEGLELEQANDVETAGKFILGLNLMQPIIEDFVVMRRPDCIIADKFYPWTSDLAARLSIPRLVFDPYSIFAKSLHEALLNPNSPHLTVESDYDPFVIPDFPHRITMTRSQLPDSRFAQLFKVFREAEVNSYGLLANSVSELDSVYTEYYSKKMGHKVFHIGPASLIHQSANDKVERSHKSAVSERQCLSWLDSKKPDSVVYICFGSGCVLPDAQLMEIGYALELAGSDFIWVVAGKNKDDEDEEKWLPRGFNERVVKKGKGLVVKGWAPQLLILDHPSTGGFLTHCGWNSAIEAMIAGVPLISWPFICDNFFNEKFFTQVLGIGVEVGALDWKLFSEVGTKVINREKIEKAVRKLMDGAGEDEGKEMRKKTRELGEKATRAVKEAGSSHTNLTLLIEELKQLRVEREERSDQ